MRAYIFTADLYIASTLFVLSIILLTQLYIENSIETNKRVEMKELKNYALLLDIIKKEKQDMLIDSMKIAKINSCKKDECEKGYIIGEYRVWKD